MKNDALEFGERNCAANWAGGVNRMRRFDRLEYDYTSEESLFPLIFRAFLPLSRDDF